VRLAILVRVDLQCDREPGVAEDELGVAGRDAEVLTGRERFTNPVEWVTSKNAPLGGLVLVDTVLAWLWLHHSVLRRNGTGCDIVAPAATWRCHNLPDAVSP
jgi:hypothetical protein